MQERCLTSAKPNVPGQAFHTHFQQQQVCSQLTQPRPRQVSSAGRQCRPCTDLWVSQGESSTRLSTPTLTVPREGLCCLHCSGLHRCPQQLSGGVGPSTAELGWLHAKALAQTFIKALPEMTEEKTCLGTNAFLPPSRFPFVTLFH